MSVNVYIPVAEFTLALISTAKSQLGVDPRAEQNGIDVDNVTFCGVPFSETLTATGLVCYIQ